VCNLLIECVLILSELERTTSLLNLVPYFIEGSPENTDPLIGMFLTNPIRANHECHILLHLFYLSIKYSWIQSVFNLCWQ
jgi:hypothetical protein